MLPYNRSYYVAEFKLFKCELLNVELYTLKESAERK